MAVFPLSLPQAILLNYQESTYPNAVITEMDAGPPKIRRRYENEIRTISASLNLTVAQKATFQEFYNDNLGAEFTWIDPDDSSSVSCRFIQPQPSYTRISPARFLVTFAFEVLP